MRFSATFKGLFWNGARSTQLSMLVPGLNLVPTACNPGSVDLDLNSTNLCDTGNIELRALSILVLI